MCNFAVKRIEAITGKQVFEKLLIDGYCQFDEYEEEIKRNKNYEKDLGRIYFYMNQVSELQPLPKEKFRELKGGKNDTVKEYEFKAGDLRVYAIKRENGKIIILGGYKNSQKEDLVKFRSIKRRFLAEKLLENGQK